MLAHTTCALQLLFQTVAEVDTLEELARVGTVAVELYEGDAAVLRELMQAIEARATAIREQLRLFPAPPVEVEPDVDLEPAPQELVREWCAQVRTMGPDELYAIERAHAQALGARIAARVGRRDRKPSAATGAMRVQWYRVKKTYEKPQGAMGPRYPGVLSDDGLTV